MKIIIKILILTTFVFLQSTNAQRNSSERFKRYAVKQMQLGKYDEAIDVLNKYIAQNPQKADGYNLRGLCYEATERYNYAVLDFRRAHALEPNDPEINKNLKRVITTWYKILNKKIEGHKRELAIDPNSAFDYLEIGKCYRWMEKWNLAEQWYDEYLKRDPNASPDEIIRYTEILAKTRHIKKGEKILKKYVERYPDDWRLWSRYGYFTLWLGKYKTAEEAFQTALSFKPYFKEAQDGLELAQRKGYLTLYQPRSYERVYLIDKYYRILRRNPNNYNIRFKLAEELLNKERYEEAKQQLAILAKEHSDDPRYEKLKKRLDEHYYELINSKKEIIKADSTNREAILEIAKDYLNLEEYETAKKILEDYLDKMPDDFEAKYYLAKAYSLMHDNQTAYELMNEILDAGGNELKYKLFAGQLGVWTLDKSDTPVNLLYSVLQEEPKNQTALIALGLYFFNQNEVDSLEKYVNLAGKINDSDPEYKNLKSMYEMLKIRLAQQKRWDLVAEGDSLVKEGYFEKGLEKYKEYFDDKNNVVTMSDYPVLLSMASAYSSLNKYDSAAYVYRKVYDLEEDPKIKLLEAKNLFWAGDSVQALKLFQELDNELPENPEIKVFLGDAYYRIKDYKQAEATYKAVPDSLWEQYYIEERLSWLPGEYGAGVANLFTDIFSYLHVNPYFYYFNDNAGFTYSFIGANATTGLISYFSVGVGYRYGILGDSYVNNRFHRVMFYLQVRPLKNLFVSWGFGKMFGDTYDRREYEFSVNYMDSLTYRLYGYYLYGDGAEMLYSPYLVQYRISAEIYKIGGYYNFRRGLTLRGYWTFMHALRGASNSENWGNEFLFRIGRKFKKGYIFGYELDFMDFEFTSQYYYSPQEYLSHAIWGEWVFYKKRAWELKFNGRIGYVPKMSYFIWDGRVDATYRPYKNLYVTAFAFYGQSQRYYVGYRSKSLGVELHWTPF